MLFGFNFNITILQFASSYRAVEEKVLDSRLCAGKYLFKETATVSNCESSVSTAFAFSHLLYFDILTASEQNKGRETGGGYREPCLLPPSWKEHDIEG